jgi:cysteine desulfurase/selenocysteine lyase
MERMGVPATIRASVALYNTIDEIEFFASAVRKIVEDERAKKPRQVAVAPSRSALVFPEPAAASPRAAAEELADLFDALEDWTDRYQYIISLGEKLQFMPPELKTDANRVRGCMSTVHLFARRKPGTEDGVDFLADSDAEIVRGLIAILENVFAGQSAREVLAFDIEGFFKRLGLEDNLSMGRRNGLASMIQRIRGYASAICSTVPARRDCVPPKAEVSRN